MPSNLEHREGWSELRAAVNQIRAGFRATTEAPVAGGPIELEFVVENQSSTPMYLAVGGDRARQRPGQFRFDAAFEGAPLPDPMADLPELGGPLGVVEITRESPWRQPILLNQFVALEETRERIDNGATGFLSLTCHRTLSLSADRSTALTGGESADVTIDLAIDLRRDDESLSAIIANLFAQVKSDDPAARVRSLDVLLPLRSVARNQIAELTTSDEQSVADRASQALSAL